MSKKVYLEFQLTEFKGSRFGFQTIFIDKRFKDIKEGFFLSGDNSHISYFPDYIRLGSDLTINACQIKSATKAEILEKLKDFPNHEVFKDDFKSNIAVFEDGVMNNDIYFENRRYRIYNPETNETYLKYRLWDKDYKRFFQILEQDEKLRCREIDFDRQEVSNLTDNYNMGIYFDCLSFRGQYKELDLNVDVTEGLDHSIAKINEIILKALNEFYSSNRCPQIEEIEKDVYQIYCDI
jgi:hypothetical protein